MQREVTHFYTEPQSWDSTANVHRLNFITRDEAGQLYKNHGTDQVSAEEIKSGIGDGTLVALSAGVSIVPDQMLTRRPDTGNVWMTPPAGSEASPGIRLARGSKSTRSRLDAPDYVLA